MADSSKAKKKTLVQNWEADQKKATFSQKKMYKNCLNT